MIYFCRTDKEEETGIKIEGSNIEKCFKAPPSGAIRPLLNPQGKLINVLLRSKNSSLTLEKYISICYM